MVWPFSSSPSSAAPRKSSDGAFEAPDRSARTKCWAARDEFFACLDRAGIVDSVRNKERAKAVCGGEESDLRKECADSWVQYFKQRRVMEHKKKSMMEDLKKEGAEPLPEGMTPPRPGGPPR